MIRLLGEVAVRLDGKPIANLGTPRVQRLLARLALARGSALRRDRLAWELWPDSTEAQARTNLRKLLHDLRRSLPDAEDFLDVGAETIRWRAGASAWIDVAAFEDALARGDPAKGIRHYGGQLLPACYDDWVLAERERLRCLAVDALVHLATKAWNEFRDAEVVEHARHLLRIDPVHESAYRLLMEALGRRGERSEALRMYHRCVETLEQELGVAPAVATVEVYERLRAPARTDRATNSAEPTLALVGREAELGTVHAVWRAAMNGAAHLLLVTGEAGIGKTRLVEELAQRATAEGHAVARARAYEAAGGLPWGPVVDWLRSESVQHGVDSIDDVWLTELARLLPELRARRPSLPEAPPASDVTRRPQLLDAVRRGLFAGGRPLLLVLDDLQWCDPDTLELCSLLLQTSPAAPVLVAGTARNDEIESDHPLAALHQRLAKAGTITELALGPLDPADTAEVATLVGRRALEADAAARLWKETEGNPLFVVEAVRAGFGTDDTARHHTLTPTVQAVMTARLARVSPDARHLIEIAATIGREFTPGVLAAASGTTEDDLADELDELWHRHIVRERGMAYDFTHDKLREVALTSISPARRRKLHRSVAAALEEHHADDLGPVSARLAAHYESAGLDARAVEAYERAAEHAYWVFALDDGIALLQQALRLLDQSSPGAARDEIELRLRSALGVPLVARRGYGALAVQRNYERALTLHRRLGRRPSPSVVRGLAIDAVVACRFDRASELGDELLAAGGTDHTALVEGSYVLGVTAFWRGEFVAAECHLTAAITEYRTEEAPLHIARYAQDPKGVCLCRLALNHLFRGHIARAGDTMQDALRFVAELDHPMTTGYVLGFDAILGALTPEHHDLHASVAALEAVTSSMHIGYFEPLATLLGGWRDVLEGDLDGVEVIREGTDFWREEQPLHMTLGLSLLARAFLRAGDPSGARTAIADALQWTERTDQRYLLAELLRIDAEVLALGGDRAAADITCRRALDVASEQDSSWLRGRAQATFDRLGAPGA